MSPKTLISLGFGVTFKPKEVEMKPMHWTEKYEELILATKILSGAAIFGGAMIGASIFLDSKNEALQTGVQTSNKTMSLINHQTPVIENDKAKNNSSS